MKETPSGSGTGGATGRSGQGAPTGTGGHRNRRGGPRADPGKGRGRATASYSPRTNAPPRAPEPTGGPVRPAPARIVGYVGLAVLGVLVALAGALVQAAWFPGGLLIALAGSAGLFYGGRVLTGTQIGALAPAVGWFATVFLLLGGRPEGDYVFGDELGLLLFMLGGTAVAVMCATTSRVPQSATRNARSGI
ncbi:DUF6113 family protein [Streptomyces sp. NPDC049916]|uniref:DUF6113 family protein n=1 Tax=Streptomyces sp. NPDC049916 TaxID=3155156 RepID=UPI00341A7AD9